MLGLLLSCEKIWLDSSQDAQAGAFLCVWGGDCCCATRLRWEGRAHQLSESPMVAPALSLCFPLIVKEQAAV